MSRSPEAEAAYQAAQARYNAASAVFQNQMFAAYTAGGSKEQREVLIEAARVMLWAEAERMVAATRAREAAQA